MLDEVDLKWTNFQTTNSAALNTFRNEKYLTDVTFACDDNKVFSAHKLLLTAASEHFERLFNNMNLSHHILICLDGVGSKELSYILEYIYSGQVRVPQDHLNSFLKSSQKLKLRGLWKEKKNERDEEKETCQVTELSKLEIESDRLGEHTQFEKVLDDKLPDIEERTIVSDKHNINIKEEYQSDIKTKNLPIFIKSNQNHKKGNWNPNLPHSGNKNILAFIKESAVTMNQVNDIVKQLYTERLKGERSCFKCPYKTSSTTHMKEHVEGHVEGLLFICQDCGSKFKKRSLNRHPGYHGHCLKKKT